VEAASCALGKCDVHALSSDESGTVLTGKFIGRMSFGVKKACTSSQCMDVEAAKMTLIDIGITTGSDGNPKSTGSGMVFTEYCWVAKYNHAGAYLWHKYCDDTSFAKDQKHLDLSKRDNTFEQAQWAAKASKFFKLNAKDTTGLLGKEVNYEEYAKRRVPHGF